jgi:CheY-like chemotaxis protein
METSNILIVEDEFITALDIKVNLLTTGLYNFELVASGEEAVEKASELNFDIILMDIHLKGLLNGIETARIIREQSDTPIIYISGNTEMLNSKIMKETYPNEIVGKPINNDLLSETIVSILFTGNIAEA